MDGNINRRDFPAGAFSVLCADVPTNLLLGWADFQRITIMKRPLKQVVLLSCCLLALASIVPVSGCGPINSSEIYFPSPYDGNGETGHQYQFGHNIR